MKNLRLLLGLIWAIFSALASAQSTDLKWEKVDVPDSKIEEAYRLMNGLNRMCLVFLMNSGEVALETFNYYYSRRSPYALNDILIIQHWVSRSRELSASGRRLVFPEGHRREILYDDDAKVEDYGSVNPSLDNECWNRLPGLPDGMAKNALLIFARR